MNDLFAKAARQGHLAGLVANVHGSVAPGEEDAIAASVASALELPDPYHRSLFEHGYRYGYLCGAGGYALPPTFRQAG